MGSNCSGFSASSTAKIVGTFAEVSGRIGVVADARATYPRTALFADVSPPGYLGSMGDDGEEHKPPQSAVELLERYAAGERRL